MGVVLPEETNSAVLRVVVGETMKNKDTDGVSALRGTMAFIPRTITRFPWPV